MTTGKLDDQLEDKKASIKFTNYAIDNFQYDFTDTKGKSGAVKLENSGVKGRYLQNIMKDRIIKLYPVLGKDDIRTSLMSESGADIKLTSHTSRKLFPYSIECKNRQDFKTLYNYFNQARRHVALEPLLVVKMNRERPLAVIDLEHLFRLIEDK